MSAARPPRFGDRVLAFVGLRLVIWLLAARAFAPAVLNDPVDKIAYYHDEHSALYVEEAARRTFVEYHQLPAWDPYYCGGIVGISNATSMVLAPDFLFRLVFGTLSGRRLAVLFFIVFGMEGTFRYARRNGASAIAAAMGAVAFSTSGTFANLLRDGWVFMFNFNLLPWAALSYEEGLRKKWWIVAGGFFMAWLMLGGGTYQLPYTVLVLVCLAAIETVRAALKLDGEESVRWWRPAATFVGVGVSGAMIAAIRLLPLLHFLGGHTRGVQQKDQTAPLAVLSMLAVPREHGAWGAGAGEVYVGSGIFLLAVLALVLVERKAAKYWALALLFGVLACGEFIPEAPYLLMRKLPVFGQLRFPIRMLVLCAWFLAVASTFGLTKIEDLLPNLAAHVWAALRRVRAALPDAMPTAGRIGVALAAAALSGFIGYSAAHDVIEHTQAPVGSLYTMDGPRARREQFRQARGNRWDAQVWPFVDRGSLHCFDENELFESPRLRGDLAQEEYPAPESPDMTIERVSWSPLAIVLRVHAPTPGRFLVNQNHADPWKTDVGQLSSDGGLISVRVPAGDHVVTLRYSDWRVNLGAFLSALTGLAIAYFGTKHLRRRGAAFLRWYGMLPERMLPAAAAGAPAAAADAAPAESSEAEAAATAEAEKTEPAEKGDAKHEEAGDD